MTRTNARTTFFLLVTAVLCFGCSPLPAASFTLSLGEGVDLPLYSESRSPENAAGTIIGSGTKSATYSLKDPAALPGQHPALEIRYTLDGAARLDLFARDGRRKPFLSTQLGQGAGELRWRLDLPPGTSLARLRFTSLPRGGAEDTENPSRLSVIGVSVREAEYGIETGSGGAAFSRGSSLVRNPTVSSESVSVEHPYAAEDDPVAVLGAGPGRVRLHTEEGRTAVIDFFASGVEVLPLSALGGAGIVTAEMEGPGAFRELYIRPSIRLEQPFSLDLGSILALPAPEDAQSPYTLFRWSVLPETLVFDFRDYSVQDAYLKRLAFFVEKEGFRGRLASDAEIARLHGWNAHDYRAQDLAKFFDRAAETAFPLSTAERELQAILEAQGILIRQGSRIQPGRGAFISISRESSVYFRRLFLNHEASHALMFLDEEYRRLAQSLWKAQGAEERRFWNVFLSNRDYDSEDVYLSYNEFQAYMVQQPLPRLEAWLRDIAYARLAKSYPERAPAMLADLEAALPGFKARAAVLDDYLRKTYGLGAGAFERVRFD